MHGQQAISVNPGLRRAGQKRACTNEGPRGDAALESEEECIGKFAQLGIWTEQETGEFVRAALTTYSGCGANIEGYRQLEESIMTIMTKVPESNKPWLVKLLDNAKSDLALRLRTASQK